MSRRACSRRDGSLATPGALAIIIAETVNDKIVGVHVSDKALVQFMPECRMTDEHETSITEAGGRVFELQSGIIAQWLFAICKKSKDNPVDRISWVSEAIPSTKTAASFDRLTGDYAMHNIGHLELEADLPVSGEASSFSDIMRNASWCHRDTLVIIVTDAQPECVLGVYPPKKGSLVPSAPGAVEVLPTIDPDNEQQAPQTAV